MLFPGADEGSGSEKGNLKELYLYKTAGWGGLKDAVSSC